MQLLFSQNDIIQSCIHTRTVRRDLLKVKTTRPKGWAAASDPDHATGAGCTNNPSLRLGLQQYHRLPPYIHATLHSAEAFPNSGGTNFEATIFAWVHSWACAYSKTRARFSDTSSVLSGSPTSVNAAPAFVQAVENGLGSVLTWRCTVRFSTVMLLNIGMHSGFGVQSGTT